MVIASSSANTSGQQTILLPQSIKQPSGSNTVTVLQSGGVPQQILLPAGFQGGTLNIKALQGLKVIPVAQSTQVQKGKEFSSIFHLSRNLLKVINFQQTDI